MDISDKSGVCMYRTVIAGHFSQEPLFVKLSLTFQFNVYLIIGMLIDKKSEKTQMV